MSFLYWIYDDTCGSEIDSGYVGVTENLTSRLHHLRRAGTVPRAVRQRILFEGTRQECLARERELRPHSNIGWNAACGGSASSPAEIVITASQYRALLERLSLTQVEAARLLRVDDRTSRRWIKSGVGGTAGIVWRLLAEGKITVEDLRRPFELAAA